MIKNLGTWYFKASEWLNGWQDWFLLFLRAFNIALILFYYHHSEIFPHTLTFGFIAIALSTALLFGIATRLMTFFPIGYFAFLSFVDRFAGNGLSQLCFLIFVAGIYLTLFFFGPGKYSVDALLAKKLKPNLAKNPALYDPSNSEPELTVDVPPVGNFFRRRWQGRKKGE